VIVAERERYRRLLRWYPRAWRDRNGDLLVDTMLDDAELKGRTAPSVAERFSAIGYGLGTRLDGRLALRAALVALIVAAAGGALSVWGTELLATADASWALPVLMAAVAPGLIAVGAVALARQRDRISEPRALVIALLSALALSNGALAFVAWGEAFDAADEGVPPTGLAAIWIYVLPAAWALGAAAIALFADALLRRSRLHRVGRGALALVTGALLAPTIGFSLISPYFSVIGAAGLALLTLVPVPGAGRPARAGVPVRPVAADVPTRTRRLARLLGTTTALVSAAAVVYALTGSRWSVTTDATAVMGQGITISLVSALPLLAAIGVLVVARGRNRPADTWGPLLLVALAVAAVAVAYRSAPSWNDMAPGFAVGSALTGAALAWWLAARLPGHPRVRIVVAVLIGVGYAALLGMMVAPMFAFALPLIAVAFAVWAPRRPLAEPAISGDHVSAPDAVPSRM
jgi:hypothetical protein